MKIIIAKAQVKPDMRAKFIEAAEALVAATRSEAGCIAYEFYESPSAPGSFVMVERWADEAAIDRHFTTPHMAAFFGVAGECVTAPPQIEEFTIASSRMR